ncbi:MAG: protein kinase [Planctomyces sp.]|nr:protein kinase [Planctomyces sp.]
MKRTAEKCSPEELQRYLAGALSPERESAVCAHLETCGRCRDELEDTAGGESWRSEVMNSLTDDAVDAAARLTLLHPQPDAVDARALAEQSLAALSVILTPTDDPRMLGRIGAYEVAGVIGRGAMGVVVKALQPALNRYVAIKVLAPELAANAAARVRFEREAQAAAAVVHEHVVPIHAVGESRGTPYLVMQYVSGGSLEKRLADEGLLTPAAALRIALQIAKGLSAAHSQGLIHRDIKPGNILLESGLERVLLTDFGLARAVDDATLTNSGFIAGTPQYMSPEQARGESIDHRSDLFSLGSVLYTLLSGRPPFRSETAYGLLRRICDDPHRPLVDLNLQIAPWLSGLVDLLLAKDRDERFGDAEEVAELLSACLAHIQSPAQCPLPGEIARLAVPRRELMRKVRRAAAGAALLTAAAGLASLAALWPGVERLNQSDAAGVESSLADDSATGVVTAELTEGITATAASRSLVPEGRRIDEELQTLSARINAFELTLEPRRSTGPGLWDAMWAEAVSALQRLETGQALEADLLHPAVP